MIDYKLLEKREENGEYKFLNDYKKSMSDRGHGPESFKTLELFLELSQQRREIITQAETAKAHQNKVSGEIAQMKRKGEDASSLIEEMGKLSSSVKEMESRASEVDQKVFGLVSLLPNVLNKNVPFGTSEKDNKVEKVVGEKRTFSFKALEHFEIGEKLGIIDFERAGKVTGARFAFLRGAGAQLERSLIQFMMDLHSTRHGYEEMIPPFIVNSTSLFGTGQFPKFKEDVFGLQNTDYYLIPTAEVPVTNFFSQETLREEDLPKSFSAYSPCFRSEAGSYGRDTKGLIRQHQFNKVELMTFAHPEKSYEAHEQLTSHAEQVLLELELPFRRMLLCSSDMSGNSAKTYDLEVWLPGQNAYREISSCSNFEDYQARRANIRFKPKGGGKPQFVHTLNGSGLAVGRTLVAILENYQQQDGSVAVPKVLQPYMGGKALIQL